MNGDTEAGINMLATVIAISTVVMTLTQIVKKVVPQLAEGWGVAIAAALTTVFMGVWLVSQEVFPPERNQFWVLAVIWVAIFAIATGQYSVANLPIPLAATRREQARRNAARRAARRPTAAADHEVQVLLGVEPKEAPLEHGSPHVPPAPRQPRVVARAPRTVRVQPVTEPTQAPTVAPTVTTPLAPLDR